MNIWAVSLLPMLWALAANAATINTGLDGFPHVNSDNRITNGTLVKQGDAPYLVCLYFVSGNRMSLCGGTIIDSQTIVTAGHCVHTRSTGEVKKAKDTYIFYGSVSSTSNTHFQPTNVILHPDYNPRDFRNDIAVLRFDAVKFERGVIEAIPIYDKGIDPQQAMQIYGWGTTRSHGTSFDNPSSLLTQTVYVSTPEACQVIEPRYSSANESQICTDANYNVGVDACQGDSGTGSTIKKDGKEYFAGLVSYGTNRYGEATCGEAGSFGMYTRVSHYLSWIKSLGGSYTVGPPGGQSSPSPSPSETSTPSPTPVKPKPTCYFFVICF